MWRATNDNDPILLWAAPSMTEILERLNRYLDVAYYSDFHEPQLNAIWKGTIDVELCSP